MVNLKNLELDIYNCSKKWTILRFSVASSKFRGKWQIPPSGVKIRVHGILLALPIRKQYFHVMFITDFEKL